MKGLAIDYAILLPALLPLAGLVLVLVADLVSPHLRRLPYAVAGLAALGSAAATVPGLALGGGSTRETFCLTGRARRCAAGRRRAAAGVPVAGRRPRQHPPARGRRRRRLSASPSRGRAPTAAVRPTAPASRSRPCCCSRPCPARSSWPPAATSARGSSPSSSRPCPSSRSSPSPAAGPPSRGRRQLLVTSLVSFALLVLGVALWFAGTGSPFLTPDAALSSGGAFSTASGRRASTDGVGTASQRRPAVRVGWSRGARNGARRRGCRLQALARAVPRVDAHGIRRFVGARGDVPRDGVQGGRARGPARRAACRGGPRHARRAVDRRARPRSA